MVLKLPTVHLKTGRDRSMPASFGSLNSGTSNDHEMVEEKHMLIEAYNLDPYQPSAAKQAPGRLNNIFTFMLRFKHAESYVRTTLETGSLLLCTLSKMSISHDCECLKLIITVQ